MSTMYFFLNASGEQRGPVPLETLRHLVRNGTIAAASPIWCEGWPEWRTVADCAQSLALPVAVRSVPYEPETKPKSGHGNLITCLVVLLIMAAAIVIGIRDRDPRTELYWQATDHLRARLLSPSSARFSSFDECAKWQDGRKLTLSGDVDFSNAYGVILRKRWFAVFEDRQMVSCTIPE